MLLKRLNDRKAVIPAKLVPERHRGAGIQPIECHSEGEARRISFQWLFKRSFAALRMTIGMLFFLLFPAVVFAAAPSKIELPNPLGTTNILDLGARLIQAGLGIAGSLALLFFIYGGFLWLTSGGVPDKIKKGRDVFLWSTVGLVIIFSSYMMVDFVIKALTKSQTVAQNDACITAAKSTMEGCYTVCEGKTTEEEAVKCSEGCNTEYDKNTENCKK